MKSYPKKENNEARVSTHFKNPAIANPASSCSVGSHWFRKTYSIWIHIPSEPEFGELLDEEFELEEPPAGGLLDEEEFELEGPSGGLLDGFY